jgi:hypothetical protein
MSRCAKHRGRTYITATNRIQLVLFGIQNRTLGPYLAAIHRILILIMGRSVAVGRVGPSIPLCRARPRGQIDERDHEEVQDDEVDKDEEARDAVRHQQLGTAATETGQVSELTVVDGQTDRQTDRPSSTRRPTPKARRT